MKIQINHIGKMEGHTDFVAEIMNGDVKSAKLLTAEGTRLIEGILVGRHFTEAPIVTARICGICPVVHNLTSIKAIENALDIKVSEQTVKLRQAMSMAQIIHSHALHLFFLSLADFFDIENDLQLIKQYPKETQSAMRVRDWALKIIEVIGGRAIHPINSEVGGFKVTPNKEELQVLLGQYQAVLKDSLSLIHLVLKIKYPKFSRTTKHVALSADHNYAIYDGDLNLGGFKKVPAVNFAKNIKEIEEPYRHAKSATLKGEPFMVGALARINLNHQKLNPLAAGVLKSLNWELPQYNSFCNITAQAIEVLHAVEEVGKLLTHLVAEIKPEASRLAELGIVAGANPLGKLCIGAAAVEAPRGTLYHHYEIDANGFITNCDIITPTCSFLRNLEEDIKTYLPDVIKMDAKKRSLKIRALIRAYDPCISCATH